MNFLTFIFILDRMCGFLSGLQINYLFKDHGP